MKKKLQIVPHVNYLDEAFMLLYLWANKDDMGEELGKYVSCFSSEDNTLINKYHLIMEIYDYVKERFKDKKERIDYYFKDQASCFSTFAALAIVWNLDQSDNKLQSYEERFSFVSEEQKVRKFTRIIDCEAEENTPADKLKTITDLITFIEASSYSKEAKWEAIKIFNNQAIYYKEVTDILEEVIDIFQKKFGDRIVQLERTFVDYWEEYQKTNDIIDSIREKLSISWEPGEAGTLLIPTIFQPISILLSANEEDKESSDILRIGFMLDQRLVLVSKKLIKEDIVDVGKLLSDKSKVDILELIGKKPCYGKEIANELKLSTATISYHMNALLKIGFIRAEVSLNRVYYSINKARISDYLDEVKNYFIRL